MRIKKNIVFLLLSLFLCSLFAEKKSDFNFSVTPKLNYTTGRLGEYLTTSADDYYISYLEWNYSYLFGTGISAQLNYKKLGLSADVMYYLPFSCGNLYDSDYNANYKTNLATMENQNKLSWNCNVNIFYNFDICDYITLSPYLQIFYSFMSFSSKMGYGYFGANSITGAADDVPWNSENALYRKTSHIDYYQESYGFFTGFNLNWKYKNWEISLLSLISPYTYTQSLDTHNDDSKNKGTDNDQTYNLFGFQKCYFTRFKEQIIVLYKLNKNLSLNLEVSSLFGNVVKGPLYTDKYRGGFGLLKQQDWQKTSQKSGVDIYSFSFNLGCVYKF